ncbi:MAG: alpha/beta hydrolase [Anaerolineae bacterium]
MTAQSLYRTPAAEQAVMALYDSALARWPVPYETLNLPTRHGSTYVIASGQSAAPPLILLHGAGTNSAIWGADVAAYCQRYRVYAVDLLGEAGRSAPNRPDWESPAYAEWLEDVLDGLQVKSAGIVGISQGAWTALKFATACAERVSQLVLMCPGGIVPDRTSFIFKAIALSLLGKWGTRRMVRMLYGSQPIPDGVEDIISTMLGGFNSRIGMLPIFTDADLRRLTMPVMLLGGTHDPMRDLDKIAARLKEFVPQLEVTILPGAGHVLMDTSGRVLAFLCYNRH